MTSFAALMVRSMGWDRWIQQQFKKRRNNIQCEGHEDGTCERCGFCCHLAPPSIGIEEIPTVAKFLRISEDELIKKYLTLNDNAPDRKLRPAFIRKGQEDCEAGRYLSSPGTWDKEPCVFYDDKDGKGKCKIYEARPKQCRVKNGEESFRPDAPPEEVLEKLGFDVSR